MKDALSRLREEVNEATTRSLVQQEATSFNKAHLEDAIKRMDDKVCIHTTVGDAAWRFYVCV